MAKFGTMQYLIDECKSRNIKPRDIFQSNYNGVVDPERFLQLISKNTSPDYIRQAKDRISKNREGNVFYDVLLAYLDSEGTGNTNYERLDPAAVSENLTPIDGRHRAMLCCMLDIKLPVKIQKQENLQEKQEQTVYNALASFPAYKKKYGEGSAWFELKHNFRLNNNELAWAINKAEEKGWIDEFGKELAFDSLNIDIESIEESLIEDFEYPTGRIVDDRVFDISYQEIPYYRDFLKNPIIGNRSMTIMKYTPKEYFNACAQLFGTTFDAQLRQIKADKGALNNLFRVIDSGKQFPITVLDYTSKSQEGRHRMYVVGERFGWDTKFPVEVITWVDKELAEKEEKEKEEKEIFDKIEKAVFDSFHFTYRDIEDFKEQLWWSLKSSFYEEKQFSLYEKGNQYIVEVDGVEYSFPKNNIEFEGDEDDSFDSSLEWEDISLNSNLNLDENYIYSKDCYDDSFGWGINESLSSDQEDYFKNSVMRDESKKLIPFYHGSNNTSIRRFFDESQPSFFSQSKQYAIDMGDQGEGEERVYEVYLNITNPFDMSTQDQVDFLNNDFKKYVAKKGLPWHEDLYVFELGKPLTFVQIDSDKEKLVLYKFLRSQGKWDGLIVDEDQPSKVRSLYGKVAHYSYVPFDSNQIKLINNIHPTTSKDIDS